MRSGYWQMGGNSDDAGGEKETQVLDKERGVKCKVEEKGCRWRKRGVLLEIDKFNLHTIE